jgi:GNAT superfamily N-acetyltransferase
MNRAKSIYQPEKDNPIWRQLLFKLAKKFEGTLDIIFPKEWNEQYFSWFHIIEEEDFRWELRYSFEKIAKTLENQDLVFWFVTMEGEPQIFLLGYSIPHETVKSFYLDTLAVRRRGKGIGHIVMDFLIRWARTKQYQTIILDTELTDEKGIPLQQFYAKHGFKIIARSETGNVTMKCVL